MSDLLSVPGYDVERLLGSGELTGRGYAVAGLAVAGANGVLLVLGGFAVLVLAM